MKKTLILYLLKKFVSGYPSNYIKNIYLNINATSYFYN